MRSEHVTINGGGGQDIQVRESLNPYSQKTSTQRRKG